MSDIRFTAMPSQAARHYQSGGTDAYGMKPERKLSDGGGIPCRHCLDFVDKGEAYLILAHRPFPDLQPYAETGPIFLHAEECERYQKENELPPILGSSPDYILRGYGHDDRIVYGTGAVTASQAIEERSKELLARQDIAYLHVRSSRNNCYQCRIDRA